MGGTQIGTEYEIGVGETLGTYTIESIDRGNKNVAFNDVNDEDGALSSRLVTQDHDLVDLVMVAKSGADADTDFPPGSIAAATGFTSYYVNSMVKNRTQNQMRVTASLENIGQTSITTS